ncbi:MAG: nucleotidyltransferase family protein [Burkholderiaceae bacterium]
MSQAPVGLLLAAGLGTRFDPSGERLKLLQPVARGPYAGRPLAWAAAQPLLATLAQVVAVVRPVDHPHQHELHSLLRDAGCQLAVCPLVADGMGASIACGVNASANASAWVIALADMPDVAFSTVAAVIAALSEHECAVPTFDGRRGHPVGFSAACRSELLALTGDSGARSILERHTTHRVEVDDPGVLFDIDLPDGR